MKTIWIINHYAGNTQVGMEYRHFLIAKGLQKYGYKVIIITSAFTHLLQETISFDGEFELRKYDDIDYVWIKTKEYRGNGLNRLKNMISFTYKVQKNYKSFGIEKPSFIITSSPHPFIILNGYYISKYFEAKLVFEERDLWPMSIINLTGMNKWHPLIFIMQWLEDFAYKNADLVISPLGNLEKNIRSRKIKHKGFLFLPNGVLEDELNKLIDPNLDVQQYIPNTKFIVGFAGTIGPSNCVDYLIKSALVLKNESIGFVIIGEGEQYEDIIRFKKQYNLLNVFIAGKKNKKTTLNILSACDVLYNAAPKNPLYQYGLSAIKVPEYMFLGKYIINAVDIKNDIIELAQCGSTIEPENTELLAAEILQLSKKKSFILKTCGERAKDYVLKHLTYNSLVKKLEKKLTELA